MNGTKWLEKVSALRSWERGGRRAPHKPLLLVLALGQIQRTGSSAMRFIEVVDQFESLLGEFGPPRAQHHPEYPFYHLRSDGLWCLDKDIHVQPGCSPTRGQLLTAEVSGRLDPGFERDLRADPSLLVSVAKLLLDRNFPLSLHHDICNAVGIDIEEGTSRLSGARVARDARFREGVLVAYEYRCAVCRYQGQLGGRFVGLDAAHVRWRAVGGPDAVENGLCLCSFHHKLLDAGVIAISDEYRVMVSQQFIGHNDAARALVFQYKGAQIESPQQGQPKPAVRYLRWHREQVFRAPARPSNQNPSAATANGASCEA